MEAHTLEKSGSTAAVWRGTLAGFCATLVGIGLARFSYPPLIPALIGAGWFTPSEAVYLGATNLAGYLIGAFLAGRFTFYVPACTVIRVGMVIVTLSFIACAWPLGFWWFFPWRFASGFTGALLMVLAPPTILAHTPIERWGRVGGIIFTGVGIGIAASGTLVPLLVHVNIVTTWYGLAAASAVLTALAWSSWPSDPAMPRISSPGRDTKPGRDTNVTMTLAIGLLLAAYGCNAVGFVPHTVFLVDFVARGLDQGLEVGGGYWALFGIGATFGPLITGFMADHLGFGRSLQISLAVKGVGVGLPLIDPNPVLLTLSCISVGALTPGVLALASGRVGEIVGPKGQKQVWGWMTMIFAVAQAGAAYSMSFIFSQFGSYRLIFAIGTVMLILGSILDFISSFTKAKAT